MTVSLETLIRESGSRDGQDGTARSLVSFLAIGGAAALGFILLSGLVIEARTGMADWLVSSLCYAVFVIPVYLAHRRLSFRSKAPHLQALPRYLVVQASAMGLATMFSWIAYGAIRLPSPTAAILVIVLTSGVNFVVLRLWAFATPEGKS